MAVYKAPSKKIHRGFVYLNDETLINSLSAVEAGKIDEVAAKVNSTREAGFGAGLGFSTAKIEGAKKSTSEYEEEITKTRTRFSIFETWYQNLIERDALGRFEGWGPNALDGVAPGHTIELRAVLEVAPIQTLLRLFLWFADKAKAQGNMFSQKGEELKELKDSERNVRMILAEDEGSEILVLARPLGDAGPPVAIAVDRDWVIGKFGMITGEFTVVAQVDRVLAVGEEIPTMRLTHETAPTPLEVRTMKDVVGGFTEAAEGMGVAVSKDDASVVGPAVWLTPIAIFR